MRLGVLDVGSNTVHLLVVDAHRGRPPRPGALAQDRSCASPSCCAPTARSGPTGTTVLVHAVAEARRRRRGRGRRGPRRLRDLRRARRHRLGRRPAGGARRRRRRPAGAARRGRGAADLPGGAPVVRLERRPAAVPRHRRRLARARGRHRRGAGGGAVGAARRRPAHPRPAARRPAAQAGRRGACASTSREQVEGVAAQLLGGRPARPRRSPPARRSARWPGSTARRRTPRGRGCRGGCGAAGWPSRSSGSPGMTARRARRSCPASRRAARAQLLAGAVVAHDGARACSASTRCRSARGRCARASSCAGSTGCRAADP